MNDQNNLSQTTLSSLISQTDQDEIFKELNLQNLPEDKKQIMMNKMIDTVMGRIFLRLEPNLTEEDNKKLDELEKQSNPDQAITQYLVTKFPNLDEIAREEIIKYKEELKFQINTIVDTLDQAASKLPEENGATQDPQNSTPSQQTNENSNDSSHSQPV